MAKDNNQDQAAFQALKQALSAKTPERLYLFHGEETYLRDYYLGRLKELLVTEGTEAFNHHKLEGKGLRLETLQAAVDALPMLSEHSLVEVWDCDLHRLPEGERAELMAFLEDLPDYCCLVFVYDVLEYKTDARLKLHQLLNKVGSIVAFRRQQQSDLIDWVQRRFRALNRDIDRKTADYLVFLCGGLMTNLISEIEKIASYSKQKSISRESIDAVASPLPDAVVFRMTDAIAAGEADQAASILSDLLKQQEEPTQVLAWIGKNMRQLYSARLLYERGHSSAELAGLWNSNSSYFLNNLIRSARGLSLAWCRRAVRLCGEADLAMKSSSEDDRDILKTLLMSLLALPRGASR